MLFYEAVRNGGIRRNIWCCVVRLSTINRDNLRNLILLRAVNFDYLRLVDAYSLPDINIVQNAGGGG